MGQYGPHLLSESMQCKLCEKRIPVALAASGCEKNQLNLDQLAAKIANAIIHAMDPNKPEIV